MTGGEMPVNRSRLMKQFEEWGKQREERQATAKAAIGDPWKYAPFDALLMQTCNRR